MTSIFRYDGDGLSAILIMNYQRRGLRLNGKSVSINTLISADQIKRLEFSTAEKAHEKIARLSDWSKDDDSDNGGEIWDPTDNTPSIDIVSVNEHHQSRKQQKQTVTNFLAVTWIAI